MTGTCEFCPLLDPGNGLSSFPNWERRGQGRGVPVPRLQVDEVAAGQSGGNSLQPDLDSHPKTSFHA